MNKIETILIIVLTSFALLLSACGNSGAPKMEGVWVDPEGVGGEIELGVTTFESNILSLPGATVDTETFEGGTSGTYEVKDDTLIVTYHDGTVAEYPMEKINGVWVIHLNKYNENQVWVKAEEVEKYLGKSTSENKSNKGELLPGEVSLGDKYTDVLEAVKTAFPESEVFTDDDFIMVKDVLVYDQYVQSLTYLFDSDGGKLYYVQIESNRDDNLQKYENAKVSLTERYGTPVADPKSELDSQDWEYYEKIYDQITLWKVGKTYITLCDWAFEDSGTSEIMITFGEKGVN